MSAKSKPKSKPAANGPPVPAGDVLTLTEAAAFLRVAHDVLRQSAETGRVPGRWIGDDWRFGRAALLAWLGQPEEPKKLMSAVAGAFADDETLLPMVEEVYRERKR